MADINWQKVFETGIPVIDDQNRDLVSLINKLESVSRTRHSESGVHEAIVGLVNYIRSNFATEEQLMAENQCRDTDCHAEMHLEFSKEVAEYLKRLKAGGSVSPMELLSFLKGHLINHVICEDTKLREFCKPTSVIEQSAKTPAKKS